MNLFQITTLFLIIMVQLNGPAVCDLIDDIKLSQTGDVFWDWMWGGDDNETDGHKPEEHIKEELEFHYGKRFLGLDSIFDIQKELDFHIFNLHDFDKNKLLDGLEMLSMLTRHDTGEHVHRSVHTTEQNIAVIDMVLRTDDKNNDGYLDYNEFKSAKANHAKLKGL